MLGDDTRAALNGAPCAVAIASVGYAEHPDPIGKIGVAYDGSPESKTALATARGLAAQTGASVHALDVISIPTYTFTGVVGQAFGDDIDEMLNDANSRLKQLPGVDGRAMYGLAGEELAAFGDHVDILSRLTRLRAHSTPRARQHLLLPRAPRTLLIARAAPRRWPARGSHDRRRATRRNNAGTVA